MKQMSPHYPIISIIPLFAILVSLFTLSPAPTNHAFSVELLPSAGSPEALLGGRHHGGRDPPEGEGHHGQR
jgi:hypothetical protein